MSIFSKMFLSLFEKSKSTIYTLIGDKCSPDCSIMQKNRYSSSRLRKPSFSTCSEDNTGWRKIYSFSKAKTNEEAQCFNFMRKPAPANPL